MYTEQPIIFLHPARVKAVPLYKGSGATKQVAYMSCNQGQGHEEIALGQRHEEIALLQTPTHLNIFSGHLEEKHCRVLQISQ